jgi:hypothetical protein
MVNKISTIKERVVLLIEQEKIVKETFFKKIGVTSANFRGRAKETPLNSTTIANIFSEIPNLSLEWLLTGYGEMYKNDTHLERQQISSLISNRYAMKNKGISIRNTLPKTISIICFLFMTVR